MSETGAPSDHVTPYDRLALDEPTMLALLAAPVAHEGLVEYFGPTLHAELVPLARRTLAAPPGPCARRVYVLPGIMGSQLGIPRGRGKPNDIVWLDPIDFQIGRLTELRLGANPRIIALGAMNYSYLRLALSLRAAGYDAVLLDYDWRRDVASLGAQLAGRIESDGRDNVAIVGHSMGGLVARAALTQAAGRRVSQLVMLGTPNAGSYGAVQAMRGTYSVVRKLAQLDPRHEAEYLAREVFSTFPGLHELLPMASRARVDLFDESAWPSGEQVPDPTLLRAAARLDSRLAPGDSRCQVIIGCNRPTATGITMRAAEFEYEYSRRGDGTVPIELAQLPGSRHRYVDCGHSELPLETRVIAGIIDLLATGDSANFGDAPTDCSGSTVRIRDTDLRGLHVGKLDWPHLSAAQRREFLDTLNEAPLAARV